MRRLLLLPLLVFTLAACDSGGDEPIASVRITGITIDAAPFTAPDGGDWDNGLGEGSADAYVRVQLNGITVDDNRSTDFEDLDANDIPATLNLDGGFTLNQLAGDLTFELVDNDGGAASADPVMGETQGTALADLVTAQTRVRSFSSTGTTGNRVELRVTFEYR